MKTNNTPSTMTARKYNKIAKNCNTARYSQTFAAILAAMQKTIDLNNYTAVQIAQMIDFASLQHRHGYEQAMKEIL